MQRCRTFWTKRLFDLSLSLVGLLISAPLWLLIGIIIKLEDGGSVFYMQERVGKGGARFKIRKFRSMTLNRRQQLAIQQAENDDKRVTAVGRILRATGMDELPQLWNIFKGEMSFVGPRPLLPEEIEVDRPYEVVALEDVPGYEARHQVIPGLTGLAQIFASRHLPRRQKFRLDLLYIRNQTFLMDVRFIVLSCWIVLRGRCGEPWNRRRYARAKGSYVSPAINIERMRPVTERLSAISYARPISSAQPETKSL